MPMLIFSVVSVAILAILLFLSELFPGVQIFITNHYELMLVFITGVYAFSTHKIVQASEAQINELKTQNVQLQKQHEQNIGVLKYEKRVKALRSLIDADYKTIDPLDVIYLFSEDIFKNIRSLDALKDQFDSTYNEVSRFSKSLDVKTRTFKRFEDVLFMLNALILKPGLKEVINRVLEEVIALKKPEQEVADYLRSEIDKLINVKQKLNDLQAQTIADMERIIKDAE